MEPLLCVKGISFVSKELCQLLRTVCPNSCSLIQDLFLFALVHFLVSSGHTENRFLFQMPIIRGKYEAEVDKILLSTEQSILRLHFHVNQAY